MNETKRNETKRNGYYYLLINRLSFKLFIALLSFILLFSISCKSNANPGNGGGGGGSGGDEISDGTYIPSIFFGKYERDVDGYDSWVDATVDSNSIKYVRYYYITNATYFGENTWSMNDSRYKPETDIKKFGRNDKGQRILIDLKRNYKYTNIYIHTKDK